MYILRPVPHPTIWGGTKLKQYICGGCDRLGHLYMVNGHREMSNEILNGKYRGKTLREAFETEKKEWNMEQYEEFPLTVALVDAAGNLSIQVHPDDVTAERIENQRIGKTESWLFLDPPDQGFIYAGCRCATKDEVEAAVLKGEMERVTGRMGIARDDYVCVEAGTLHAMTAGCFVYEIEYGSDFTYRFYDYDRRDEKGNKRELHIDKALLSIKPQIAPKAERCEENRWMRGKHYEVCKKTRLDGYKNESEGLECISVIEGSGRCEECELKPGMSVILLPGEELSHVSMDMAIVARLRTENEKAD